MLQLPKELAGPVFAYFDLDGDKAIDDFEFVTTLVHLTYTDVTKRLSALFSIYDTENKETVSVEQFDILIGTILRACGQQPSATDISEKLRKLKLEHYLGESYVTTDQFAKVILADPELLAALAHIGILSPKFEAKDAPLDDLELELQKYYVGEQSGSELSVTEFGFDRRSEIDTGILDTLMQKAAVADTVKPFERDIGASKPEFFSLDQVGLDEAPNTSIKPEYIYGYRGYDTRNNLFSNSKGSLVYCAAKAGIILNTESNTQKFLVQHAEAVSCLDVYGDLAVSGELGARPILCFWDCVTSEIAIVLAGVIKEGAAVVRFAKNGKRLVVGTVGEKRWIYILDVEKALLGARKGRLAVTNQTVSKARFRGQRSPFWISEPHLMMIALSWQLKRMSISWSKECQSTS